MLLKTYRKEIFRPECNPNFTSLHCYAHLNEDVGQVIPYLNAELGGFQCTKEPPSITFKIRGRLITVHSRQISINSLKDEEEAEKIVNWMKNQINEIWERRDQIKPCFTSPPRPQLIEILKLLPKTNCKKCGLPTCMVFATQVVEGVKGVDDCLPITLENKEKMQSYLKPFDLDF